MMRGPEVAGPLLGAEQKSNRVRTSGFIDTLTDTHQRSE